MDYCLGNVESWYSVFFIYTVWPFHITKDLHCQYKISYCSLSFLYELFNHLNAIGSSEPPVEALKGGNTSTQLRPDGTVCSRDMCLGNNIINKIIFTHNKQLLMCMQFILKEYTLMTLTVFVTMDESQTRKGWYKQVTQPNTCCMSNKQAYTTTWPRHLPIAPRQRITQKWTRPCS